MDKIKDLLSSACVQHRLTPRVSKHRLGLLLVAVILTALVVLVFGCFFRSLSLRALTARECGSGANTLPLSSKRPL